VRAIDVGYDVDRIVTATVGFKDSSCNCRTRFPLGHEAELSDGLATAAARLARLPGVEGIALATPAPCKGTRSCAVIPSAAIRCRDPKGKGAR